MYHLVRKDKGFFSIALYKGQQEKTKRQGFGIQLFPNGCFYIGFWKQNKAHGMGRLVINDGTYYEGIFHRNVITEGTLSYYNGAKFEGLFDATPYDRFKNGSFTFKNGTKLIAEWKEGGLLSGTLYESHRTTEITKSDLVIRKKGDSGVVLQKHNKWMYEGGIRKGMCDGEGIIYCTFQQYKSGTFERDRMNGKCYKVSLNWGEITEGQRINDKKFGNWTKMLNRGFLIESNEELSDEVTISFPFLNEDLYVGTIKYSSDPKSKDYGFLFKQGVYYFRNFGELGETRIDIKNCVNLFDIPLVEKRGISFENTFSKIFKNQDLAKKLKDFLKSAIMKTGIRFEGELEYFLTLTGEIKEFQSDVDKKKKEKNLKKEIMKKYYQKKRNKSVIKSSNKKNIRRKSTIGTNRNNKSMNVSSEKHVRDLTSSEYSVSDFDKSFNKKKKKSVLSTLDGKFLRKSRTPIKKHFTPSNRKIHHAPFDKSHITVKKGLHRKTKNFQKKNKIDVSFGKPQSSRLLKTEIDTRMPIKTESIISDEEKKSKKKERRIKKKRSLYTPDFLEHFNFVEIKVEKEITFFNGSIIEGKKQGFCKILYNTGIYIEAFFIDNIANGEGFLIMENLFEFRGNFKNGFLEGKGSLKINDQIFKGNFRKGIFVNEKIYFSKENVMIIFNNKSDREIKSGKVTLYSNNSFKLIDCEVINGNVCVCKCKMYDNYKNFWIGKIKKFKESIFMFETSNSPKRFFSIDLINSGKIELIKNYK